AEARDQANDVVRTDGLPARDLLRGEFSCGERGRAASLRVGSPAERNARARCSGPPCTTPLDYAPCTGPDPPRRGARQRRRRLASSRSRSLLRPAVTPKLCHSVTKDLATGFDLKES